MSKAIIWCRVSTDAQEFETQKADLIRYANGDGFKNEDLIIIGEKGASAIKMNDLYQKEVDQLVTTIKTVPGVSTIYVWEVSRLARNELAFYKMKDEVLKRHVQFICFVPRLTLLDPDGQVNQGAEIMLNLLVTLAKQEMEIKAKRFSRGKRRLANEGKYNGGNIPFGYKVDENKKIVIDEDDAKLVREVYDLYESGITQPQLAKEYYRRGETRLTISFINNILNNKRYTGDKYCYVGSSFERSYPVIISPQQFEKCREIAKQNNTTANKARNIYYASKLIVCPNCGCYFSASGSKVAYHCYDSFDKKRMYDHRKTPQCTNKTTISINIMDSLLWYVAQQAEVDYILNAASEDKEKFEEKIEVLNQKLNFVHSRLEEVDKKRKRIVEAYLDLDINKEERDLRFSKLDEEKRAIQQEQVSYLNEKEHIENLLEELGSRFDLSNVEDIARTLEGNIGLLEKISSITDDKERSEIVHRHVKKVTVVNSEVEYKFIHRGRKKCKTRFITIELFNGEILYFQYIPNSGGKNIILKSTSKGQPLEKIDFEYLPRYYDEGKHQRQIKARDSKQQERAALYPEDKYVLSYSGLAKFLHCSIGTGYRWVEKTKVLAPAVVGKYCGEIVVDKEKCIEILKAESDRSFWAKQLLNNINH